MSQQYKDYLDYLNLIPNYTASAQNRIIFVETRLQIIDFTISKKIAPQNIWCGKYF